MYINIQIHLVEFLVLNNIETIILGGNLELTDQKRSLIHIGRERQNLTCAVAHEPKDKNPGCS